MKKTAKQPKPKNKKRHWRGKPSSGAVAKPRETVRKCIVTGETLPMEQMIRFCVAPDRTLVPDLGHKLPGRGIWVTADCDAVALAVKKGLFTKPARGKVSCPADLDGMIRNLFVQRLKNLLGVAKKAGSVTVGFEKVAALLQKQQAAYVVEAKDGAKDGREKITRLCEGIPVVSVLTKDETADALGTAVCAHAALKAGGVADLFATEAKRYLAYCRENVDVHKMEQG